MKEEAIIQSLYPKGLTEKDDCYYDGQRLYSTDSLVEGTHFLHSWSNPKQIASKLVEVNISDILASGGYPEFCLLNLGLSKVSRKKEWLLSFTKEFKNILKNYDITLAGGDTFSSKITSLSLTIISKNMKNVFLRSGAQVGNKIYITGPVGLSILGYKTLKKKKKNLNLIEKLAIQKHLRPKSRIELYDLFLRKYPIHSMMDSTDGLVQDLQKYSKASQKQFVIYAEKLPMWKTLREVLSIDEILTSGEELELVFTASSSKSATFAHEIGEVKTGKGVIFYENERKIILSQEGFLHF